MDILVGKYTGAIDCLRETLKEGRKPNDVDIRSMLANVHQCETTVEELIRVEQNSVYANALTSVARCLSGHATILNRKICRLNSEVYKLSSQKDTTRRIPELCTNSAEGFQRSENFESSPRQNYTPVRPRASSISIDLDDSQSERGSPRLGSQENLVVARRNAIESTITSPTGLSFDQVVGLEAAKKALREAVITPVLFPHLFSGGRQSWRRILLYGPPGTGKSRLAQAVSAEVKATFYSVSSTDLMSSWVGETEKLIKELFQHARNQAGQSVIFIDEIDSLCRRRNSREDEGTRRIKTELLIQMGGREWLGQDKIFLLCATNCPWDLDVAFLRRFHKRIYIPLPDLSSRVNLLRLHCRESPVCLSDADWQDLATRTEGYSGSDLATLVMAALMIPISELHVATSWTLTESHQWSPCDENEPGAIEIKASQLPTNKIRPREVKMADFLQSLSGHRPTVCREELQKLDDFTAGYGQAA